MSGDARRSFVGLALLAAVVVAAVVLLPTPDVDDVRDRVSAAGVWGPLTFLVLMVGATQLPVPRTVWTVSAGILFTPLAGCVLALTGMALSVTLSLVLIRWVGSSAVRRAERNPSFRTLQQALEQRGWVCVLGLRLIPVVPFSLVNYACGLSRIPLVPCILATVVGSTPLTVAVVLTADSLVGDGGQPWFLALSVVLALTGVALTADQVRRLRWDMAVKS